MWIGIDFDLAVGLCSTGASRSDREMMLCLGNLYLQINSLSYSVFKFCVRSRKMRSRRIALSFWNKSTNAAAIFCLFFSLTIKDKTNISLKIKILHLGQGSFTRKVRTIFTLKIIVSIFVKLFLILVLHLRQFFIVRIFVKRATGMSQQTTMSKIFLSECDVYFNTTQL